jgi:hypothetical protein
MRVVFLRAEGRGLEAGQSGTRGGRGCGGACQTWASSGCQSMSWSWPGGSCGSTARASSQHDESVSLFWRRRALTTDDWIAAACTLVLPSWSWSWPWSGRSVWRHPRCCRLLSPPCYSPLCRTRPTCTCPAYMHIHIHSTGAPSARHRSLCPPSTRPAVAVAVAVAASRT